MEIRNVEHVFVYKDPELAHACNQVSFVALQSGELLMGFNEERYPIHADSGQSCLIKSGDGGSSWDCAFAQISDGTVLMHTRVCNFIAPTGIKSEGDQALGLPPPGMTRLADGRLVCLMRTSHRPNRQDNMWFTQSEDDGITWCPPKRTSLWGYPADVVQLSDGRVLAVYGYRKQPWGVRGCVSEDGATWDVVREFTIREGGVPRPSSGTGARTLQDTLIHAQYWHIGYPSVVQLPDGTIITAYHEYSDDDHPIQYLMCTRFRL